MQRPKAMIKKAIITLLVIVAVFLLLVMYETFFDSASEGEKMGQVSPKSFESYQSVDGVLAIHHWTNKLGTKVYFVPVQQLPMVDIRVAFDAGSARDTEGKPLAYFANHLLNQGTKEKDADEIADTFEVLGAQFSAHSARDMAIVHLRSLSDEKVLTKAVSLFAEVMSTPAYKESVLKRERQDALSDLKFEAQTPGDIAERTFYETIYGDFPYANWALGDEKAVKNIKAKEIKTFHQTYYTRSNALVVIVGDVSLEQANALSIKVVQDLPQGQAPSVLADVTPTKKAKDKNVKFSSTQTHIMYGMPVLKRQDADLIPLLVGNHILGGNSQNNRVFDTIRGKHGLAYSAYSYFSPMRAQGPFVMACQTRADQSDKAQTLLKDLLEDFIDKGPTDDELKAAKANIIGGHALKFDSNKNIAQQVATIGFYDLPLTYFDDYTSQVDALTTDAIVDAFKRRVDPDKMTLVKVGASK